jgi:His-Xaa-Ser system protein HxsD
VRGEAAARSSDNSICAGGSEEEIAIYVVDLTIYGRDALYRACYLFTDRCYLFLSEVSPTKISVEFRPKAHSIPLSEVIGAFANELINQRLRADLARETRPIRELIVAEAFRDADFRGVSS